MDFQLEQIVNFFKKFKIIMEVNPASPPKKKKRRDYEVCILKKLTSFP